MSTEVIVNEEEIKQQALTVIEQAKIVKIRDQGTYTEASILLLDVIMPLRKRWKNYWYGSDDGPIPLAYKAYKSLLHKFNDADGPLETAERNVKGALSVWDDQQKILRQELQRQADAEARRKEEESRQNAAAVAEDSGASAEEIEAIIEAPAFVVAAPVLPTYEKASGISTREAWSARVVDMKRLCAAIAKGTVPISYVEPNMTALNARARADRGTMNVPGVVAQNVPVVSGRSSR